MLYTIVKKKCLPVLIGTFSIFQASAQQKDTLISLKDAIAWGDQNYHLLNVRKYDAAAADKNVDVVKYSRLPTIDASYQAGISTANNLTGVFYPTGILPISGPPTTENTFDPATGSAAGILLNWKAVTFGERNARINTAVSEADVRKNRLQKERFQVGMVVPFSAVVTTLEKKFVIKVSNGVTQWIDVCPGFNMGEKLEIFGDIKQGDTLVLKGTEELKADIRVIPSVAK